MPRFEVSERRFEVSERRFEVAERRFEVSERRFEVSEWRFEVSERSDPPPPPTMLRRQAIFFEQPASLSDGQTATADAANLHAPQNRKHACNCMQLILLYAFIGN